MRIQLLAAGLALTALSSVATADVPSSGYKFTSQVARPVAFAAFATLNNGDRVLFDGEFCELYDEDGVLLTSLGSTGAGFAFSSFVSVDPTETFAIVGESSNHGLFKVDLVGGGLTPLGTMMFNFAAVFESPSSVIISAATCGFNCGNDLIRVDTTTGVQTVLGHVPGPSGPVAFAPNGDLYYGTQSPIFPTPEGANSVVRWSAAQVASGSLDELNWTVFTSNLTGCSSLAIDPATANVFVAESTFGRARNFIFEYTDAGQYLGKIVSSEGTLVGGLEFLETAGSEPFRGYRENLGSTLSYHSTDFVAIDDIIRIAPRRAEIRLAGSGVDGVGRYRISVSGAQPHGKIALWRDAQDMVLPAERSVDLGFTYPVISDLGQRAIMNVTGMPGPYNFDGLVLTANKNGEAFIDFFNNGRIDGVFAYQAMIMTPQLDPIGTSNTVLH